MLLRGSIGEVERERVECKPTQSEQDGACVVDALGDVEVAAARE